MSRRRIGLQRREQPFLPQWQQAKVEGRLRSNVTSMAQLAFRQVGDLEYDRLGMGIFFRSSNNPQLKK